MALPVSKVLISDLAKGRWSVQVACHTDWRGTPELPDDLELMAKHGFQGFET